MKLRSKISMLLMSTLLAFAGSACGKKDDDKGSGEKPAKEAAAGAKETTAAAKEATAVATKTPAAGADISEEAKTIFKERCEACHGASGAGDGVGAAALNPKPRNYTDAEWQKSVTDEDIAKVIIGGGLAVGKSPIMPGNPDLKDKKEVVDNLVKLIRSFGPQ